MSFLKIAFAAQILYNEKTNINSNGTDNAREGLRTRLLAVEKPLSAGAWGVELRNLNQEEKI